MKSFNRVDFGDNTHSGVQVCKLKPSGLDVLHRRDRRKRDVVEVIGDCILKGFLVFVAQKWHEFVSLALESNVGLRLNFAFVLELDTDFV